MRVECLQCSLTIADLLVNKRLLLAVACFCRGDLFFVESSAHLADYSKMWCGAFKATDVIFSYSYFILIALSILSIFSVFLNSLALHSSFSSSSVYYSYSAIYFLLYHPKPSIVRHTHNHKPHFVQFSSVQSLENWSINWKMPRYLHAKHIEDLPVLVEAIFSRKPFRRIVLQAPPQ